MANIREQDSWVHKSVPETATEKAKQLTSMAVAKARRLHAITRNTFEVNRQALVIGGGLAGMTAALSIARQGFPVYLVERKSELGGNLRHIFTGTSPQEEPQSLLSNLITDLEREPRIQLLLSTEVVELSGYTGQFRSRLRRDDGNDLEIQHGIVVLATGARENTPHEYQYGEHPGVLTQRQLEEKLQDPAFVDGLPGRSIVMIQCVGSREPDHPYCSRICCTQAIKNALAIKRKSPDARITILYRDLRTYGFRESIYRQARRAGVIFLEYSEFDKPNVSPGVDGRLEVTLNVQPEVAPVKLPTDWLILSAGIEPEPENVALAKLLKVPLNEAGFFNEAHVKLRPVDFAAEGIFLAGLAHSPRSITETIAQAQASSVRAVALLSKPQLSAPPIVASVNPRLCSACGLCVEVCPYGARRLEPEMAYAEVIEVLCQGCGACIAACPNKASQQKGFEFKQVFEMIEAACV
jgi:heterodisulfide reductase subunit A-like polyferredoxin